MPASDYINEANSYHQSSSETFHRSCYYSDMNSDDTRGEVDFIPIFFSNETNIISINDDVNVVHK